MSERKEPYQMMSEENNNLSSAQEVEYVKEFKKADNATKKKDNRKKK